MILAPAAALLISTAALPVSISADPRLELAGLVHLLSRSSSTEDEFASPDIDYMRDANKRYAAFVKDPAVLAEAGLSHFSFGARAHAIMRLGSLPALRVEHEMPNALVEIAGGDRGLTGWVEGLRAFSRRSGFESQFETQRARLEVPIAAFRREAEALNFLPRIESYTGLPFRGHYNIWLSPFQIEGARANVIFELPDGSVRVDSVFGPVRAGPLNFWARGMPGTLWHEAGHGILDALGDFYAPEIAVTSAAFAQVPACNGDWLQCVKEHVVGAVELRLTARYIGEKAYAEQLESENSKQHPWLEPMCERLKEYEADRARFPTLADFYPRLLEVLPSSAGLGAGSAAAAGGPIGAAALKRRLIFMEDVSQRAKIPSVLHRARRTIESLQAAASPRAHDFPSAGDAARNRAMAAYEHSDFEAALAGFDEVLVAEPTDASAWLSRGVVLQALKRPELALNSCSRALTLAESSADLNGQLIADTLSSRAALLKELGREAEAKADLERAAVWRQAH